MDPLFEENGHLLCEKNCKTFKAVKILIKARSLSSDEIPDSLLAAAFEVACAYAYKSAKADFYFSFSLASFVAKNSSGQDSDD